jgi:hypothetical protein
LFRAGAAPWHDDLACYRRLAARLPARCCAVFESLDVWDIGALIAHSAGYAGSSLHGRIAAMSFGLPRITLLHPRRGAQPGKLAAFIASWEAPRTSHVSEVEQLEEVACEAFAVSAAERAEAGANAVRAWHEGIRPLLERLA